MTQMAMRTVQVDGGQLYLETVGTGPPVVLLHPGIWDSRTWEDQFGVFSRTYRCLRYDFRGYGKSSRREPGVRYSHVDDLAAVMDAAGIDRAALVGCSMGGRVSVDFALTHPARVAALVLAAPGLTGFEETEEERQQYAAIEEEIEAATAAGDLERSLDLETSIWAVLGTEDERGARIRQIAFDNLHERTMDESGEERPEPPAIQRLEEIAAPTLVLPADHDPPVMIRICHELAARIPGARLVEIPQTDHVVNMRQPAEFNRVVLEFLGEVL